VKSGFTIPDVRIRKTLFYEHRLIHKARPCQGYNAFNI
jgi:hypothetical protein